MKNLIKVLGLSFLLVLFILLAFTNVEKRTVVIDVGHGGIDAGTTFEGYTEKYITLEIAKKIKDLNENSNLEIILTRESDDFVELSERAKMINNFKPDLAISLHLNSADNESLNGTKVYISDLNKEQRKSGNLALNIFYNANNKNVEIKKANYYLLRESNSPIAYIDMGFITNKEDRVRLTTEEGQTEIAKSILEAIK